MGLSNLLVLFLIGLYSASALNKLVNLDVSRNIDLTTQIARSSVSITFQNEGNEAVSTYEIVLSEEKHEHLSFVAARSGAGESLVVSEGEKITHDGTSWYLYKIALANKVEPSGKGEVHAIFFFTHIMKPFPAHITQMDPQLVLVHGNHYFSTPYKTLSQTTLVFLPSPVVESKSELSPTSFKDKKITYGPYKNIAAFSVSEMRLHFQNHSPFVGVRQLTKEIEISNWGNIAVTEYYTDITHDGAILDGSFSRFDYQRNPAAGQTAIPILTQQLPLGAADVYYRDEIGNISTSHVVTMDDGVTKLELIPRFTLFGGWKVSFYTGYNLPIENYLFADAADSGLQVLNITFSTNFPVAVIDRVNVRIIFPEGASDIEFHTPFAVEGPEKDVRYTYLDVAGRPVLTVSKSNVIVQHNQYFQVTYRFSSFAMLQEPLLLIFAYFLLFLTAFFFSRFELKISKK